MSGIEVVARHADGRVQRGQTWDFRPDRPWFRLQEPGGGESQRVPIDQLKALFFVRSLEGDSRHVEKKSFDDRRRPGRKTWVEFVDGECLAGWTEGPTEDASGFFLFPVDPASNNEKVYVVQMQVLKILHDEDAARQAREVTAQSGPPKHYERLSSEAWRDFLGDPPPPARPAPGPSGKRKPHRPSSGMFLQDF